MPFGLAAAGISAGGSLLGGLFGSKGASNAAKQQAQELQQVIQNTNQAVASGQGGIDQGIGAVVNNTVQGQQDIGGGVQGAQSTLQGSQQQQEALYNPFVQAGTGSLASLQQLAGPSGPLAQQFSFNPSDLQNDPGYAFTLQQGQQAIQRAAAAQGNLFSSGTLKSLAGYTAGTANQYFNDAYNRALSTFQTNRQGALSQINTLQNLAGLGYGATQGSAGAVGSTQSQLANTLYGGGVTGAQLGIQGANLMLGGEQANANLGMTGAQIAANALTGIGNARAAGTVGSTNSWLGALQGGTNSILGYLAGRGNVPGYVSAAPPPAPDNGSGLLNVLASPTVQAPAVG